MIGSLMTKLPIYSYLKNDSKTLGKLLLKFNQLKVWNGWLREALPNEIALTEHCKIVGLDKTSLIVIADNSHWVTRFRFFIPGLLTKLQSYPDLQGIRSICCKVMPQRYPAGEKKTKRERLKITTNTAVILQESANKIKHVKLKKVLEKMAQRAGEESD